MNRAHAQNFQPSAANDNKREAYIQAIQLWVGNIRLQRAMSQQELGDLEGIQRHLALSKGLLPNLISLCRRNKRADSRASILAIVHLCADNNDGLCRLSVTRFAQLLDRSEQNIRDAISDLEEGGELGVNRSASGNSYWPRIDIEIAQMNPSMGWFMDALSDKPQASGRPLKVPQRKEGAFPEKVSVSDLEKVLQPKTHPLYAKKPPQRKGEHISLGLNHSEREEVRKASYSDLSIRRVAKVPGKLDAVSEVWA